MKVVGYSYDAAVHCPDCTYEYARKWDGFAKYEDIGNDEVIERMGDGSVTDSEGNPFHPVFDTDEAGDSPEHCDDCGAFIDNSWSGETVKTAVDALMEYVIASMRTETIKGNTEALDTWVDNLQWCVTDDNDDLIIHLYKEVREREKENEVD